MNKIFEIIDHQDQDTRKGIALGVRLKIGDYEAICPVSKVVPSLAGLNAEIQAIKGELDEISIKAKRILEENASDQIPELHSDMPPEKIWEILSSIKDTDTLIDRFNTLDEDNRREVADYILTRTNIFTGKGSEFASRYDSESGLLV